MGNKFWCYTSSKSLLMLSDILFVMTITFVIYQDTQSVAYAAVFPLIRTICQLLAGLFSPVLTDYFQAGRLLKWVPFTSWDAHLVYSPISFCFSSIWSGCLVRLF